MSKFLAILLASNLTTAVVVSSPIINNAAVKNLVKSISESPFYKNINNSFENWGADIKQACAGSNNNFTGANGLICTWSDFADNWDEFQGNYGDLNLEVNMEIAFDWYNVKWTDESLTIPLNNINLNGTNWIEIHTESQITTQPNRWDSCQGRLNYNCWRDDNNLWIQFQLVTWATTNYDNYYFSIDTRNVICNATFDYNSIKNLLDTNVNNQTLNTLQSDYSTSLEDERNHSLIDQNIQQLVESALGSYYQAWAAIIFPLDSSTNTFAYNDSTGEVTLTIQFNDPNTNEPVCWTLSINVVLTLSGDYWTKTLKDRLSIIPGQVINPNDPNGSMIADTPLEWAGSSVYGTTAALNFTGAPDDSETMKVNGQPIEAINHQFNFNMTDQQTHTDSKGKPTNEYDILLEKHDLNDWSHILGHYEVKYVIKQNVPPLQLKWYAWDPEKNPDQNILIQPTINDKPNPKYDPEVNPKTGTKTQIIWVKHLAENPFPLDPLDQSGEKIIGNRDPGFIAEASVSGMGIQQLFDDPWINSVTREAVNAKDLSSESAQTQIHTDDQGQYFSASGTYHYTLTDQKGFTSNKFIIIGQDYQNKYAKFLDILNNPAIAVDFWTTTEGLHLKYYLISNKQFDSKKIFNLNFEAVSSNWKEYVSDMQTQHVPIPPDPGNIINLNNIELNNIKMNAADIKTIRNNIINGYHSSSFDIQGIVTQLKKLGLENNIDYKISNLDDTNLSKLLNFNDHGSATLLVNVNALPTSTKAAGATKAIVINFKDSLTNAVDFAKINFDNLAYNYSSFTVAQLKTWILADVTKVLADYPYIDKDKQRIMLQFGNDYTIKPLKTNVLQAFLSSKIKTTLTLIISATSSNKAVNSTTLCLINDPKAPPVPPNPPDPKPKPNPPGPKPKPPLPNPGWFSQGKNLAWFLPVIIVSGGALIILIWWFKIRRNKKIK